MEKKYCLNCSEAIAGRTDKKFCDDACRSSYHSRSGAEESLMVKQVNLILRKNRRILMLLNPESKVKVHKRLLLEKGFDFRYFTSIYKTEKLSCYHFCYEMGYLLLEQDHVLLVRKKADR
jgi:predicted nucleic acid-binding Zn ribbon protein